LEVQLHAFLTSILDEDDMFAWHIHQFTSGKKKNHPDTQWTPKLVRTLQGLYNLCPY
jgi:hypothetical protein